MAGALALAVIVYGVAMNRFGLSFAERDAGRPLILAHRGVHQTFDPTGLDVRTGCSATRIDPPTHDYLENTVRSIEAAFGYGADIVEIDLRPTADGEIVVFHDDGLGCRTEIEGKVRDTDLATLRTLDAGHGYTADGGQTYPFRGQGVGEIRTLAEVLDRFPDRHFLLDFKSGGNREVAARVGRILAELPPERRERISLFGRASVFAVISEAAPGVRAFVRRAEMRQCAIDYLLVGWSGWFPESCRDRPLGLPWRYRHLLWGYPHVFLERAHRHGATFYLGDVETAEQLSAAMADGVDGIVTNHIQIVGPAAER